MLFLFNLALWGCSGNQAPDNKDGSASEDPAAVETEDKAPLRPAMLNRRNRVPFDKTLEQGPIRFHLSSLNVPVENTLLVMGNGFEVRNDTFQIVVEGLVTEARLADLDKDGFPEAYAFSRSTDSDSTAHVYGFASFRNRSYGPVGVSELSAHPDMAKGYKGHGRFYFEDGVLKRSFPIFEAGKATEKKRIVTYNLRQGEASFILEPVSGVVE